MRFLLRFRFVRLIYIHIYIKYDSTNEPNCPQSRPAASFWKVFLRRLPREVLVATAVHIALNAVG